MGPVFSCLLICIYLLYLHVETMQLSTRYTYKGFGIVQCFCHTNYCMHYRILHNYVRPILGLPRSTLYWASQERTYEFPNEKVNNASRVNCLTSYKHHNHVNCISNNIYKSIYMIVSVTFKVYSYICSDVDNLFEIAIKLY